MKSHARKYPDGTSLSILMGVVIKIRPEIDRERILAAFCGEFYALIRGRRYKIDCPFGVGTLAYATDGASIVRTELASRIEVGDCVVPDMEQAYRAYWPGKCFWTPFTLPSIHDLIDHVEGVSCPLCDDRRVSLGDEYPDFGPNGEPVDHALSVYGYDVDDNSIRDRSCQLCRGLTYRGPNAIRIRSVAMAYSRLKPIAAIGNVEVASTMDHVLLFRGNGFEGIAMGLDV